MRTRAAVSQAPTAWPARLPRWSLDSAWLFYAADGELRRLRITADGPAGDQFSSEHDVVIYPRENHGFTERTHQIDVLERVRSWSTRWLGDPAEG